jgi:hypothetical protein
VGKPGGNRPLGRPRNRWVDDIETDLGEIVRGGIGLVDVAQDEKGWRTFVSTVMNILLEVLEWLHSGGLLRS